MGLYGMGFSEEDLIRKGVWKAPCEHYLQRFVGEEDRFWIWQADIASS